MNSTIQPVTAIGGIFGNPVRRHDAARRLGVCTRLRMIITRAFSRYVFSRWILGGVLGLALLYVARAADLNIGWASVDLTPDLSKERQAVISGLLVPRFSSEIKSRVTATALALESVPTSGNRTASCWCATAKAVAG